MKKIFLTLFIILFFSNVVFGACSITGGACAIEDLNPQLQKQNIKKDSKNDKKQEKRKNIKLKNTKKGGK